MAKKIILITGARPNFIKAAPLLSELHKHSDKIQTILVHTGQHYNHNLSQLFFEELKMPKPDIYLGIGSGSHSQQTAGMMTGLEKAFEDHKPDMVVVFGDVNSTLAGSLVASKMCIPIAHVESGLRSFDMTMPEEVNRIVTDRLSDICFVSENSGMVNLRNEGVSSEKMFFVGNIMIDSLIKHLEVCRKSAILDTLKLTPKNYVAITLHRPSNVDNADILKKVLMVLKNISKRIPIVFPCHPRTKSDLEKFGLLDFAEKDNIRIIEPLGYIEFLRLQSDAKFILTDSGGIQEETTYLHIPCVTLRYNTERPVTVDVGSNVLTGPEPEKILAAVDQIFNSTFKAGQIPPLWDGATAGRIADIILKKC